MEPQWIRWARALQAISQTGLHFAQNKYDLERYRQIQDIAAEVFSDYGKIDKEVVDPEDIEMLQDLVMAATNEALRRSQEMMNEEMSKFSGGLQIPGMGSMGDLLGKL